MKHAVTTYNYIYKQYTYKFCISFVQQSQLHISKEITDCKNNYYTCFETVLQNAVYIHIIKTNNT